MPTLRALECMAIARGGLMTFLALAKVSWIKAAVAAAPVTNLFHQIENRRPMKKLYEEIFGGGDAEYIKRSPML